MKNTLKGFISFVTASELNENLAKVFKTGLKVRMNLALSIITNFQDEKTEEANLKDFYQLAQKFEKTTLIIFTL